jgi:hypothetical protein
LIALSDDVRKYDLTCESLLKKLVKFLKEILDTVKFEKAIKVQGLLKNIFLLNLIKAHFQHQYLHLKDFIN